MHFLWTKLALVAVVAFAGCCQMDAQSQDSSTPPPPVAPTLSPPVPPQPVPVRRPDPLPSSPDAPVPDLGSLPSAPDKTKSSLRRTIDRLTPRCLDGAAHTCWSSPPEDQPRYVSDEDRKFVEDMEVGDFNLKDRNYRGAELRFRDALTFSTRLSSAQKGLLRHRQKSLTNKLWGLAGVAGHDGKPLGPKNHGWQSSAERRSRSAIKAPAPHPDCFEIGVWGNWWGIGAEGD
jgi:hypothetical protein